MSLLALYRLKKLQEQGGASAFHNMSAPPKSRITLRPLREPEVTSHRVPPLSNSAVGNSIRAASGLAWVMRLDLDGLIEQYLPDFSDRFSYRLHCCLAIARLFSGLSATATQEDVDALRAMPYETVCDELREIDANIAQGALELPPIGLVIDADKRKRPCETNPARVLFVLSRLNGTTFVRDSSAMVSGRFDKNLRYDLWVAA